MGIQLCLHEIVNGVALHHLCIGDGNVYWHKCELGVCCTLVPHTSHTTCQTLEKASKHAPHQMC